MKVKVFSRGFDNEPEELEAIVQAWLEENPDILVKHMSTCSCTGTNILGRTFVNLTITVLYR